MVKRKPRVKETRTDPAGFLAGEIMERDAGTGALDQVTIRGIRYHRARYWTVDDKGVRVRRTIYGRTEREAQKKLAAALKAPTATTKATVAKMNIETYLRDVFLPGVKRDVRPSTFETYSRIIEQKIVPGIGRAPFATFTAKNARAWIADMQNSDEGARTMQMAVMVLKRAYNFAVQDDDLAHNPIHHVKLPKVVAREQHILTLPETIRFLRTALASEWGTLFYLAVATSARQGELFGMTWDRVNLDEGYLDVTKAVSRGYADDKKRHRLAEPKTKASRRRLYLDAASVAMLRDHKAKQTGPNPLNLVFPSADRVTKDGQRSGQCGGGFLSKDNVTGRVLPRLLDTAGIIRRGAIPFHSLRHVGNSLLASEGFAESTLRKRLGHGSRTITQHYTHAYDRDLQRAAEAIGRLLVPALKGTKWVNSGVNPSRARRVA